MRICQVIASSGEGGLENHVISLSNTLAKNPDLDIVVVAPSSFADRFDSNVTFEPVNLTLSRRNPFALWALTQVMRKHKPDIVHAHANKAAAMVSSVKRFCPALYVATVHGTKRNTDVYRKFDHVIAVSIRVARTLMRVPVTVIYNGVNPQAENIKLTREQLCKEIGLGLGRSLAVAVGRLAPVKGFDLLLQAWKNVDADLLIIGDGPEMDNLKVAASKYGLDDRVRFLGFRNDTKMIMSVSDFMVISSRREGFPLVMLEALQAQLPIVSTDVADMKEILPEEMIAPTGDVTALAEKINHALSLDKNQLAMIFGDAFRLAKEELTLDRCVTKTVDLYWQMVAAK